MIEPLKLFFHRQLGQMLDGGREVIKRKILKLVNYAKKYIFMIMVSPISVTIFLLVRLIRPLYLVRFNRLIGWRIGHFTANVELYLCEKDFFINQPSGPLLDIWYHTSRPCNKQLDKMWKRIIFIAPECIFFVVHWINSLVPGGEIHEIGDNACDDRDVYDLIDRSQPHLKFESYEVAKGKRAVKELGIPEGAKYVCLIVRDPAYLRKQSENEYTNADWSRHNYRDCDIDNFLEASNALTKNGYYVIRMGAVVEKEIYTDNPMIIDYACNGMRSDFLDIYLLATCFFCISTVVGLDGVPVIFRRPVLYVNCAPVGYVQASSRHNMFTVKKYWLKSEERFLTFSEIFKIGAGYLTQTKDFEKKGIALVENSPEEIELSVIEMQGRLLKTWKNTREDDERQSVFWSLFEKNELHGITHSNISSQFLSKNKELLL